MTPQEISRELDYHDKDIRQIKKTVRVLSMRIDELSEQCDKLLKALSENDTDIQDLKAQVDDIEVENK